MKKYLFLLTVCLMALFSSCNVQKNVIYLQDVTSGMQLKPADMANIHVQPGDKISIFVNSRTPELSNLFNLTVQLRSVNSTGGSGSSRIEYYTIDDNGEIDFPILGKIKVAGMTRVQIAELIKDRLISEDLLKEAVVTVEFGNLSFAVMGEVQSQGKYTIDKDQISILEALSMAHDLTINGNRHNVLVLRTGLDGTQTSYRLDLTDSKNLYNSPAYFIKQHDVIYVEPNMHRARQSTTVSNSIQSPSFWISLSSLACTIILMIHRL